MNSLQQEKPNLENLKQPKTKYDIIRSIADKSIILSHTSLKEFSETPAAFMRYKTGDKKVTDAMVNGTLEHAMLLEPQTVQEKFFIEPIVDKRTNKGKEIIIEFLEGVCINLKVSEELLYAGRQIDIKEKGGWKTKEDYFRHYCQKNVVTQTAWNFAEMMAEAMDKNDAAGWLMSQTHTNETHIKWDAFGFKWQGFIDSMGDDVIFDLKKVPDASPKKLRWTIKDRKIDWQAAHYTIGAGNDKDYYILAFDGALNITVMQIHKEVISRAWEDIERHMTQFKKCSFLNQWNASYDFYARNGVYEY